MREFLISTATALGLILASTNISISADINIKIPCLTPQAMQNVVALSKARRLTQTQKDVEGGKEFTDILVTGDSSIIIIQYVLKDTKTPDKACVLFYGEKTLFNNKFIEDINKVINGKTV